MKEGLKKNMKKKIKIMKKNRSGRQFQKKKKHGKLKKNIRKFTSKNPSKNLDKGKKNNLK